MEAFLLLLKTVLIMIGTGILLLVIVYTTYILVPLIVISIVGLLSHTVMKSKRGY